MSALSATPNFIRSASGLRRPSKSPFPWSRAFVQRALRAALPGRTEALPSARHQLRLGDLSGRHLWRQPHAHYARLQFDEPEDDVPVALAGPAHGPDAVDYRRLDLDESLAPIAPHRLPCRALGQPRGDGVIDCISKDDANHLRHSIPAEWKFHGATSSPQRPLASRVRRLAEGAIRHL